MVIYPDHLDLHQSRVQYSALHQANTKSQWFQIIVKNLFHFMAHSCSNPNCKLHQNCPVFGPCISDPQCKIASSHSTLFVKKIIPCQVVKKSPGYQNCQKASNWIPPFQESTKIVSGILTNIEKLNMGLRS